MSVKKNGLILAFVHLVMGMCLSLVSMSTNAQINNVTIDMSHVDGVPINPANIFGYQILSSFSGNVVVKGTLRYRNAGMGLSYTFHYTLSQGMNTIDKNYVSAQWQFSSPSLQELFFTYNTLPAGTYEYCVSIVPSNLPVEGVKDLSEECLYHRADESFLINLIDPEDKAKIKEFYPMLVWVANYSFSNELTYRIRVAEMKQGQNPVNAIMRNQPVFDERNLTQNSIVYPTYGKPLVSNQPYAWTVDAYYKDILLGGSEIWQFIIADSLTKDVNINRSFIDVKRERAMVNLTAIGNLKLKYLLDDAPKDTLYLEMTTEAGKKSKINTKELSATYGDNRYVLDFTEIANLKHKEVYILILKTKTRHEYKLRFQYLNPSFLR